MGSSSFCRSSSSWSRRSPRRRIHPGPRRACLVGIFEHQFGRGDIIQCLSITREALHHRFELGVFDRQVAKLVLIADDVGRRQQHAHFIEAFSEVFEFLAYGVFHDALSYMVRSFVSLVQAQQFARGQDQIGTAFVTGLAQIALGV